MVPVEDTWLVGLRFIGSPLSRIWRLKWADV